jgi:hypothetical protein
MVEKCPRFLISWETMQKKALEKFVRRIQQILWVMENNLFDYLSINVRHIRFGTLDWRGTRV